MKYQLEVDFNSADYLINVSYFHPGQNAITHLAPENCSPSEDAEIEFTVKSFEINNIGFDPEFIPEESDDFVQAAIMEAIQYEVFLADQEH